MREQYTYYPVSGYTNVRYGLYQHLQAQDAVTVSSELATVLDALIEKRPSWTYIGYEYNQQLRSLVVHDGDEEIGAIGFSPAYYGSKARYTYNCPELEKARVRGHSNFAVSPEKATKHILKMFRTKTPKERGADAYKKATEAIKSVTGQRMFAFRRKYAPLEDTIQKFCMNNWGSTSEYLVSAGLSPSHEIPELHRELETIRIIGDATRNAMSCVVVAEGDKYLVSREYSNGRDIEQYTNTTLTEHLKTALGILKLVDHNTTVPSIGMRINNSIFLILDKENPDVSE